jgi:alkanesulfonate monooxygenase SsuD/methylene tetrahydromethanopterin reductase-like flavin-dependent oxidoreductase (luciferase family)
MKFGIFYEHQLPRPWSQDSEQNLFQEALDQVELADRLGIDYAWEVEHHFLDEYSHSSAPEVFLAACSQRTKRIRLVRCEHAARKTSGADEWEYSSRK